MSQTVDNRIVEMQFDNKDFEQHAQESLKTLQELKESMKFEDAAKNLQDFNKATTHIDFSSISNSIDNLADKFSTLRLLGIHALSNIVDAAMNAGKKIFSALNAPIAQAKAGGWSRAANLENAKFQMQGILGTAGKVSKAMDSVDEAVQGTAYSLDEAAKIASQLIASGVQLGNTLTTSLKSIAGVAAQTNSSFMDIGQIFATVKGQGKLMTMQLRQLESRGMNAAATLAKYLGTSEANVRDMVTKGKISFEEFSDAMTEAFGENAAKANTTFDGALSNMKSALNRIGAEFATPIRQNAIPVFNQLRLMINAIKKNMSGVFSTFSKVFSFISKIAYDKIGRVTKFLTEDFKGLDSINKALTNTLEAVVRVFASVRIAFKRIFGGGSGFAEGANKLASGIEKFSEKLIMSYPTMIKFTDTLTKIFTVVKVIIEIFKTLVKVIIEVVKLVVSLTASIIKFVVGLGRAVVGLFKTEKAERKVVRQGKLLEVIVEKLQIAFDGFRNVLSVIYPVLQKVATGIATVVKTIAAIVGGALYLAFQKVKQIIETFKNVNPFEFMKLKVAEVSLKIQEFVDKLKQIPVVGMFVNYLEKFFIALGNAVKKAGAFFKELFEDIRKGEFTLETLKEKLMLIPAAFLIVKEKILGFFGGGDGMSGIMDTIKEKLSGAGDALKKFASDVKNWLGPLKPGRILLLAFSVAVVALTFNIFHLVTNLNLFLETATGTIKAIKSLFTTKWTSLLNSTAVKITAIGVAVTALAEALIELSEVPSDKLTKAAIALGSIVVAVAGLATVATIVQSITKVSGGFNAFSANMLIFSAGIASLVGSLWLLQFVDLSNMKKKLLILGALGTGLAGLAIIMGRLAPTLTKGSFFMIAFAGSVFLLVEALAKLSTIDLTAIQGAWKELLAIFVGLAAFAAAASNLGIGSLIGLVGFVLLLKFIFKNLDEIRQLNGGEILQKIVEGLRNVMHEVSIKIDEIVTFLKDTVHKILELKQDEFDRIMHLGLFISAVVVSLSFAFSSFSHLLRALTGATIAVTALILLSRLVAQWMDESPNMAEAMRYVGSFILLVGLFEILVGVANRIGGEGTVKASAKVFSSVGFLFLAMAGLSLATQGLTTEEFNRLHELLLLSLTIIAVIQIVIAAITRSAAGSPAGFGHFIGMTLMFATLLGSMVVLMMLLRDEEDYIRLGTAIVAIASVCILIAYTMQSLRNIKTGNIVAVFGGIIGMFLAIAGVAIALDHFGIEAKDMVQKLTMISVVIFELIALMGLFALLKNFIQPATLRKMVVSLAIVSGLFVALGLLSIALEASGVGAKSIILKLSMISIVIGELIGLMFLLKLLHDKIKPAEMAKMVDLLYSVFGIFVALAAIGAVLGLMSDPATLFLNLSAISLVIGELEAVLYGLYKLHGIMKPAEFVKMVALLQSVTKVFAVLAGFAVLMSLLNVSAGATFLRLSAVSLIIAELIGLMYLLSLVKKQAKDLAGAEAALFGMVGVFATVALVFLLINAVYTEGLLGKAEAIILILTELVALTIIVGNFGENWSKVLKGEAVLAGMIGIFAIIALIFMWINSFYETGSGLLGKVHAVMLILVELVALMAVITVLGTIIEESKVLLIGMAAGIIGLLAMVGIFAVLAQVFKVINDLKTEGILAKSQTIILVMTELIALSALSILAAPAILGAIPLLAMLGLFAILAQIFKVIDELHVDGLLEKSQAIVLVMLELEGLCLILGVISPLALAALAGVPAMIGIAYAMQEIATALSMVSTMEVGDLQGCLSIFINALNGLIEIGTKGIISGPGLTLLSGGITALGIACGFAAPHFNAVSETIISLSNALPLLSGSIKELGNSVTIALTNMANSVSVTLKQIATDIVATLNYSIENIIPAVYQVAYGLGNAIVLGFRAGAGWNSPPRFILEFFKDLTGAINGCIPAVIKTAYQALFKVGKSEEMGYRDGAGWHSWQEWLVNSFNDAKDCIVSKCGGLASVAYNGFQSVGKMTENGWNSANPKEFFAGEINDIIGMFNVLGSAINLAKRGFSSTLNDYEYQLQSSVNKAQRELNKAKDRPNMYGPERIKEYETNLKNATDKLDDFKKSSQGATEAAEELIPPIEGIGGAAGKSASEVEDLAKSLEDTLTGQMNIFDKFEKKDPMNPDQMIENMTSQITGMTEWATDMNKLATMGIDQGLLQKLAELGPEGADKVKAFVNMSADQLAQANTLWAQSLALPKQVTDMLMYDMKVAGTNTVLGLRDGISENAGEAEKAMSEVEQKTEDAYANPMELNSPSKLMIRFGMYTMEGLRNGIREYQHEVFGAMKFVVEQLILIVKNGLSADKFKSIGSGVIEGIKQGVEENTGALLTAISSMAKAAEKAGHISFKQNSPSKLFIPIGEGISEGLAVGVTNAGYQLFNAIDDLADPAVEAMKLTISGIAKMVEDGVDDPVITPILDLSQVTAGANRLNNLFSTNQALAVSGSMENLQNGKSIGGTTFIQNNYSPKALTRADIYRQTRNQFAQYRQATL